VIHLRVIAPASHTDAAVMLLVESTSVANVVVVRGAAVDPVGDMITCDVAPEDASYIVGDLRRMGLAQLGAIDIDELDSSISAASRSAEAAAVGKSADSVIWENVSARIDNEGLLSGGMVALFAFAGVIAAVALLTVVEVAPANFSLEGNTLAQTIAEPNIYSVVVAACAGAAGMLSVTLGKAGALVGVAVSITTIPAAADIGLSISYQDWGSVEGAAGQLALNIASLLVAATLMLGFQRRRFRARDNNRQVNS